jgi:hypothetical protein
MGESPGIDTLEQHEIALIVAQITPARMFREQAAGADLVEPKPLHPKKGGGIPSCRNSRRY